MKPLFAPIRRKDMVVLAAVSTILVPIMLATKLYWQSAGFALMAVGCWLQLRTMGIDCEPRKSTRLTSPVTFNR
jgi:hypothetical protein